MKPISILTAASALIGLAACGDRQAPVQANDNVSAPAPGAAGPSQAYSATGNVTAIAGDRVTISHGPVEGLGWPAMTMTFRAGDPALLQGISVGDRVTFQFRQNGTDYPLTALSKAP